MKKLLPIIIALVVILALVAGAYWYFMLQNSGTSNPLGNLPLGFQPFGDPPRGVEQGTQPSNNQTINPDEATETSTEPQQQKPIPALRLLSGIPVGGYGASTTASTTVVRWVDRGRGNIYETSNVTNAITTISNTVVPRIVSSSWNKNLTAFIASMYDPDISGIKTLYSDIRTRPPVTASTTPDLERTPYELKGRNLPTSIIASAVSPKKDKLFTFAIENERGVGYVSTFDGRNTVKIFDTPLTQIRVEWPEENIIAITTRASASHNGFLYFVNPKTGSWKKILGPVLGLSTKVSHDGKYALISFTNAGGEIATRVYTIATGAVTDAVVKTLADKCAWGNFYKNIVYCGVPASRDAAVYPDVWLKGTVSFTDALWQINASNADIKMVASLLGNADRVIDAFTLSTDDRDEYLFFINKNDPSLWSLDLVTSN